VEGREVKYSSHAVDAFP